MNGFSIFSSTNYVFFFFDGFGAMSSNAIGPRNIRFPSTSISIKISSKCSFSLAFRFQSKLHFISKKARFIQKCLVFFFTLSKSK